MVISLLLALWLVPGALKAQCNAAFTGKTKICQYDSVAFYGADTNSHHRFLWNFGDVFSGTLNTDTLRNTQHIYNRSGKFTVTLIVSDTNCSDTQTATIWVYQLPVASFTRKNGCAGLSTQFINTSTADTADPVTQWKWNLGGTDTSSAFSPSKIFSSTGKTSIKLVAITNTGCKDTWVDNIVTYKKPTATRNPGSICQNGQIDFTGDTNYQAQVYRWDFGDSTNFNNRTVTHVYKKYGILKPFFTIDFASTSCTIAVDSVIVNRNPDARFRAGSDSFCFLGNQVCIIQQNMNQKIKTRNVIFDDGFEDDFTPINDSVVCHKYTDTSGGLYSITMELIDSNNCISTLTHKNAIRIYPQLRPSFTFNNGSGCFKTDVLIVNKSNYTPPYIQKFKWDLGDGNTDTSKWTNLNYTYTNNGSFNIILSITDKYGCTVRDTSTQAINNTSFVVDARIDSVNGICRNNNLVYFRQTPVSGGTIRWNLNNGQTSNNFTTIYRYAYPRVYYPFVTVSKNGCDSTIGLDSVVIRGPLVGYSNLQNQFQCYIKDTVFIQNSTYLFRNKSCVVHWEAGDPFASNCSIDTRAGLNVNTNCNYSSDSLKFKHLYSKGQENCYYIKLRVQDTILGCMDSVTIPLALKPPLAKGRFFPSVTQPCPGPESYKTLSFNPQIPEPTCIKYAYYVMWDSLLAANSGNFNTYWQFNSGGHNYPYTQYAGDSNGYVTIGLIVENGTDSNGNACRDTGWFHQVVKVTRVSPQFTSSYSDSIHYCKNSEIHFFLVDSAQSAGTHFLWDFGDGTGFDTTRQKYISHVYQTAGTFKVKLIVTSPNGCVVDSSIRLNIGMRPQFAVSKTDLCFGQSTQFSEQNLYHNIGASPSGYWSQASRAAAGKEKVLYDIGDGNGFTDIGPNPLVKFQHPGNYQISMVARDSIGCYDTLKNYIAVNVSAVFAGFALPSDTVLCAQTLKINSTATIVDSNGMYTLPGDKIQKWEYDFGSVYPQSTTPSPSRYFATGQYNIRQIVTNTNGCKDTINKVLQVIGPSANFSIVSDSIGCAPLLIQFKNNSLNATNFIWQFGDINNNIYSTKSDTNISLKYNGYGNYYPKLVAQGSFTRNGATLVCDDIYPDTSTLLKKTVTVYELPKPNFTWSTNCATGTTQFKNTSTINTAALVSETWFFGEGSSSSGPNPSHTYADTGTYKIVLKVKSAQGCEDSIVRKIVISPSPIPYFGYNYNCIGTVSLFKDSTFAYNDRIFQWSWNFGDGTFSTQRNPSKTYAKDTNYNVTLTVTNVAGCTEQVTRNITIFSKPKPIFTFNNVCDKNVVFFKNNSTCKQPINYWKWHNGDGSFANTWNDSQLYNAVGTYNVKLVLKSVHNCADSITKSVVIHPNPIARIYVNDSDQCFKYHTFSIRDTSSIVSGNTSSFWNLGDGNTQTNKSFNYRYNSYGAYKISLLSVSNFGCKDSTTANLYAFAMPKPLFTINTADQCLRYNQFSFTDNSSIAQGSYNIKWEFGDGNSATGNPSNHSYNDTGTYSPLLILNSDKACSDSITKIIHLWPMPKSSFAINNPGQCLTNNIFQFTNGSSISRGTFTHRWEFGDTKTDTTKNTTHSYNSAGRYTVNLIESSDKNCKDTSRQILDVHVMPKASFTRSDTALCLSQNTFTFTNNSTLDTGTLSYRWYFGDGNTNNNQSPTHVYASYGKFNVKLRVFSQFNCPDSTQQQVEVYPMPQVKFTTNLAGQCINNQNFIFTDSSKIVYGTLTRKWKFSDSTSANLSVQNKSFLYPKIYDVKLIQTSGNGCIDSAVQNVVIYPKPYPAISVNDSDQCLRGNNFKLEQSGSISSGSMTHQWKFGDNNSAAGYFVLHTYLTHNTFPVTLISTSNFNCVDSITRKMIVFPMPVSKFIVNDSDQCLRQNKFIFTNTSTIASGSLTYKWNFGDTGQSSILSPVHIYPSPLIYKAQLIATSQYGCADTVSKTTEVYPMPVVNFSINDTAQCLNNQLFTFTDNSNISAGNLTRKWIFFDSNSIVKIVNRQFNFDSIYPIKLSQLSNKGCADSLTRSIIVHSKPIPRFSLNDTQQCFRQNYFVTQNLSNIKKGTLSYLWDFGTGYNTDSLSPSYKYASIGSYKLILRAISEKGCTDTTSLILRIDPMPNVAFSINDTGQCINNQQFIFTNNSNIFSGSLQHLWQLGDGNTANTFNTSKTYNYDTVYRVKLIETSNFGCQDSILKWVDVYPKPFVNYSIDDSIQCLRQNQFNFTNNSKIKYGSLQYNWYFGDSDSSVNLNATHIYKTFGNFKVLLKSTSNLGCIDTVSKIVTVGAMPVVNYSINNPGQCLHTQNFVFTNTSSIGSGTYTSTWNFKDSQYANSNNATHTWKYIGNYKPRLVLTSNYGCMDSTEINIWVNPNSDVRFLTNDSDQCKNQQNYVFSDVSSIVKGKIKSIFWNLGNGKTGTNWQMSGYYPKSGTYKITLYTTSDSNCLDSFSNLIRVYPKPAAWFTVNDSAQCLFQNQYQFDDISFDSFGVNNYNWNINGEAIQKTKQANYVFKSPGYKNITLISTSIRGCSDTISRTVYVKPMPDPDFEKLKSYYCELTGPYNFIPNTAGGNYFGKNINSNIYNPVILWRDTVKYIVTVNGCTDSSQQITQVYPGPKINLGNDTTLCKYERLELQINSWQSTYLWDDGSTNAVRRVIKPGKYWATVSNICGVKSDTIQIQYRDINCRFFLPTSFTPNGDGVNDVYKPVTFNLLEMTYTIFNRWGQIVFQGTDKDAGWDGTYLLDKAPNGVYVISVSYKYDVGYRQIRETVNGTIELIR